MSLYNDYRPAKLSELVGQDEATAVVGRFLRDGKVPNALMLTGPTGTGKTSTSRIVAAAVGCTEDDGLYEIPCPTVDPLDTIRDLEKVSRMRRLGGGNHFWVLDEFQSFSRAPHAQQGVLRLVENAKDYCYFCICTTDPAKISEAVRNRFLPVQFSLVKSELLQRLVAQVAKSEGTPIDDTTAFKVAALAEGVPRMALQLLEKVIGLETPMQKQQMLSRVTDEQTKSLAQLLFDPKRTYKEVADLLRTADYQDAEGLRRSVLGYCSKVLLSGGPQSARAYEVISRLQYSMVESGMAGLAAACYEIKGQTGRK